jgi:C4-type Zn-finger protein
MPDIHAQVRTKECPLCCETMRLETHERIERIPGSGQTVTHVVREWECPECSYEQEANDDDD